MSDCGCHVETQDGSERRTLQIALGLNAAMFVIGLAAGIFAESTGLIADAFDMLSDAAAYGIALLAVGRTQHYKRLAAKLNGTLILILGIGVLCDVVRRAYVGSEPVSSVMLIVTAMSLAVNTIVLRMLHRFRNGEVHLRATWICTRADVVANLAVLVSAGLVIATQSRYPDLIVGGLIGLYIIKESIEILRDSRAPTETGAALAVDSHR